MGSIPVGDSKDCCCFVVVSACSKALVLSSRVGLKAYSFILLKIDRVIPFLTIILRRLDFMTNSKNPGLGSCVLYKIKLIIINVY